MTAASGREALDNADSYGSYDQGMCLQWVRGPCWEIGSFYASAIDAWNGAHKKHPGDRDPPDGAPCFYRGGTYGHIVIYRTHGSGRIRSTDCTYATKVGDAALSWPETAWGDTYLGWTEDLNGVDLPLGTQPIPPPPEEDDEMPKYLRARMTKARSVKGGEWATLAWDAVPAGGDVVTEGDTAIRIGGHLFSGTLTVTVDTTAESIRTRFLERSKQGGEWETNETYPTVEHPRTSGSTYVSDARNQSVADGRRIIAQVNLGDAGGTITGAEFNALYF